MTDMAVNQDRMVGQTTWIAVGSSSAGKIIKL